MRVEAQNLTKVFQTGDKVVIAIEDLSFTVETGQILCVLGPSGCGKTTTLNLIAGLDVPSKGRVLVDGVPIQCPGPDRVLVFQEFALFPWLSVEQNIEFGLVSLGLPSSERMKIVEGVLDLVRLRDFRKAQPHELSGGMKQKVAIARALAVDAKVLLMDEPFGSLDAQTRNLMQKELLSICDKTRETAPKTIVFVTHSVDEALYVGDLIAVMTARPGKIKKLLRADLPRPRDRTSSDFNNLRKSILGMLEEEVQKVYL